MYNGEQYLAAAIESILRQTYRDFELIISDNASTDNTREICETFVAKDDRVQYYRHARNMGQGPNHNFCVTRATGEYFRWAAHDDLLEPEYLARCVAPLEEDPGAILCHSVTKIIGDSGVTTVAHLQGADSPRASERFGAVILKPHWCVDIYGVIRTSALRKTNLMSAYFGGDKTLLAELALLGRFLRVEEPLFLNRDHPGRSMRAVPFHRRQQFHNTASVGRRVTHWAMYVDYWRAVRRHITDPGEQMRCYGQLLRWWYTNLHAARLLMDVAYVVAPSIAAPMFRLRQAYHKGGIGAGHPR